LELIPPGWKNQKWGGTTVMHLEAIHLVTRAPIVLDTQSKTSTHFKKETIPSVGTRNGPLSTMTVVKMDLIQELVDEPDSRRRSQEEIRLDRKRNQVELEVVVVTDGLRRTVKRDRVLGQVVLREEPTARADLQAEMDEVHLLSRRHLGDGNFM
jgi:hypothetical protein